MSLVALDGTPLVIVGGAGRTGIVTLSTVQNTTLDAALEAIIYIGQIFTEDGASHTINTSGSSSLGWRTGTSVFANGGTTVKVGLAGIDLANGPPGRAANTTNTITFDVNASFTGGGGGITTDAWQESVPTTGSKTIAHGDLVAFAVQMTARGGVDSIVATTAASFISATRPTVTAYTGGTYTTTSNGVPNAVITFSDGVRGYFYGGYVASVPSTTQTWNSSSTPKEYGNFFQLPVPAKIYGITTNADPDGDYDIVLYSDPLGTPVAEKTVSMDANITGLQAGDNWNVFLFPSPYTTTASQPLVAAMKPGASNISSTYLTLNSSAHQTAWTLGANCYAVNRSSGAFSVQNSNKDRFGIGLIVGAWDTV